MKMNPILFKNVSESFRLALVRGAEEALPAFPILSGVRFATKLQSPQTAVPGKKQVIFSPTGGRDENNGVTRYQGFSVSIYAGSYSDVEHLAEAMEAVMKIAWFPKRVKFIQIDMYPTESGEDTKEQFIRFMTVTAVMTGQTVSL